MWSGVNTIILSILFTIGFTLCVYGVVKRIETS